MELSGISRSTPYLTIKKKIKIKNLPLLSNNMFNLISTFQGSTILNKIIQPTIKNIINYK